MASEEIKGKNINFSSETKKIKDGKEGNVLLGKYELVRLLGKGNFAKVYQARNLKTADSVAVKVIHKERISRVGMIEQIKREISIMRMVRHPNIVQLYEVMASKTKIYFVMEYVLGGELFYSVASKGKMKEDVARKYFQQLISAVDFCHSRGVFHRDLKPENLLVDENGNLKVSDFGLSALPDQQRQDGLLHTTCGTPAYVAPEVILRGGYDGPKADIWSCGVILFVMLAGYLPFHDANLVVMYRKIYKAEFKCPTWISRDARKLIFALLVPDPRGRVTIPQLMQYPWFKKSFKRECQVGLTLANEDSVLDDVDLTLSESSKPTSLNAFDIISLSEGFDLSGLFEEKGMRHESRFTSREPASNIVSKLEEIGRLFRFDVKQQRACKVKMQGPEEGRKGHLSIAAEIFEVAPSFHVVEVKKAGGDTLEYNNFWSQELKPGLKDIVWRWQGDNATWQKDNPIGA